MVLYRSLAVLFCAKEVILLTNTKDNIVFILYLQEELLVNFTCRSV